MAKTRGSHETQVFPPRTREILPENLEKQPNRAASAPIRNPQPDPLSAPESRSRPGNWPAEHTPGPWLVEHTAVAGLRVVHGEPDQHGFRDDVPFGLGKVGPTDLERANVQLKAASPQLFDSLLAVEWSGALDVGDDGDQVDCCPNCFAPFGGLHYAHCELRDSLDAALGVTSPRVVHPAHAAKEAARG